MSLITIQCSQIWLDILLLRILLNMKSNLDYGKSCFDFVFKHHIQSVLNFYSNVPFVRLKSGTKLNNQCSVNFVTYYVDLLGFIAPTLLFMNLNASIALLNLIGVCGPQNLERIMVSNVRGPSWLVKASIDKILYI